MTHEEIANAMLQVNGDFLNRETHLIDDVEDDEVENDEGRTQVQPRIEQTSASRRSRSPSDSDSDMDLMLLHNEHFIAHRDGLVGVWREDVESDRPGIAERVRDVLVGAVQYVRQRVAGLLGFDLIVVDGSPSFVSVPWRNHRDLVGIGAGHDEISDEIVAGCCLADTSRRKDAVVLESSRFFLDPF